MEGLLTALAVAFPNPGVPTLMSPKRRRRSFKLSHWKAAAMGGAAVLTMATGVTPVGVAATVGSAVDLQQHFQLDGNIASTDPTATYPLACDWATTNAGLCADASLFDHTGVIPDEFVNKVDPSAFTTGSHDTGNISSWGCDTQPFTAKDNILNTYAAAYLVPKSGDGTHRVVYMAQERESNNGDSFAGFWLLHSSASCTPPKTGSNAFSGAHTNGDLLVVSNYTNGGGTNAVTIYAWENGALNTTPVFVSASPCTEPTDVEVACAVPNASALTAPSWGPQALDTNEFVETGVDLTAIDELLASATPPLTGLSSCFTNFMSETRSSQSADADLHDYALGQTHTCPTPGLPTDDRAYTTSGTVGQPMTIGDSVTLSGGANPTGHVDFTLYSDSLCTTKASPAVDSGSLLLSSGSASFSTSWTPTSIGTYYWGVTYDGDTNNSGNSACGGTHETLSVGRTSPGISTNAGTVPNTVTSGSVGSLLAVGDTATLSGFSNLVSGDAISFALYGPTSVASPSCTNSDKVLPTAGNTITGTVNTTTGVASSGVQSFTPTQIGTYYWVATFGGDANNGPIAEACGGNNEAVTVAAVAPTLGTNAASLEGAQTTGVVGTPINVGDTGTLTGFADLLGTDTMTFGLYGPTSPSTPSCTTLAAGPWTTAVTAATGVADTGLHSWTPTQAGTYYWLATFSGDANNAPVADQVGCGDSAEAVTVTKAQPAISTTPSISTAQAVPVTVSDTASVTGGYNPAGTVTFALYGPFTTAPAAADCTGANLVAAMPAFANVALVNGAATSPGYPVTQSGVYQWVASFSDTSGNNLGVAGSCGDTTEQFTTFTAAVLPAVLPAKTGDMSIFMVLGIPFILTGLTLFGLSWRRREEQA